MAVTVNEVEVSPAVESKSEAAPEKGGGESAPPSPQEIQRLVEQQVSRCERVWAY
jgi:hypothetical protein